MELTEAVRSFVRTVPRGRVVTYADVALAVGRPGAARAVGRIMAQTSDGHTPCHRVVRSDGTVAPRSAGWDPAGLLRREGVGVAESGEVLEFDAVRWPLLDSA
jgi:O-6-methylguanine DNA methyltransferase